MRTINVKKVPEGAYLIEEGQVGDRFYILLCGELEVHKATEVLVHQLDNKNVTAENKLKSYLQSIFNYYEQVNWQSVPYARQVLKMMNEARTVRKIMVNNIKKDIFQLLE